MPLSPAVAIWLNSRGHSAIHAWEAGLGKATDGEILHRALSEDRIVITCDLDYPQVLTTTGATGPAVILLRGGNYSASEVLELLARVLGAIPEEELRRSLVTVDQKRLRRIALPIRPG